MAAAVERLVVGTFHLFCHEEGKRLGRRHEGGGIINIRSAAGESLLVALLLCAGFGRAIAFVRLKWLATIVALM